MTKPTKANVKPNTTADYNFWVKTAALTSTCVAVILLLIKLYAWLSSNASVMLATATDSLLDLFASASNLLILKVALAPADDEHKFGHGKAESLGSLFQASFITGSALLLALNGVDRLMNPVAIEQPSLAVTVTVFTLVVTLSLVMFQYFIVKRTGSLVIKADMLHYKSDLLLNVSVLAALVLSQYQWTSADGLFTLLIAVYLLFSAKQILTESLAQLMDKELDAEDKAIIKNIIAKEPQAISIHELRTRKSGPKTFIQFHLVLADDLPLVTAHAIGDKLEDEIKQHFSPCEVLIHHDPQSVVK